MKLRLPTTDSSTGRGLKTGVQSLVGTTVLLISGLILTIKGVPGCPEALLNFARDNFGSIVGSVGISSGIISIVYNLIFTTNKNY